MATAVERKNLDVTQELSEFVASTTLEKIPSDVVTRAKYIMLDGFACGVVGAKLEASVHAVETLRKWDGDGPATIWGWNAKVPPATAALLNGTFVQGFELDDYHSDAPVHNCAAVLPSALGAAEHLGNVDGKRFLEGVILGFEMSPRIGMAMGGIRLVNRGFHCGSVFGILGAAVGAAKVLNLSPDQIEDAIAIAATQASGLLAAQYDGMVKRMHTGMSARNGILGAALASGGFKGFTRPLEREYGGLVQTFCQDDPYDLRHVTADLGKRWEVSRIAIKPPYSSMGGTHCAIEAIGKLRARPEFDVNAIEKIEVGVSEVMMHHGGWRLERPTTVIGAQMNVGYCACVAIVDGTPSIPQFAPNRINRDDVWEVLAKCDVIQEPTTEGTKNQWGGRVKITYKDGKVAEERVELQKGRAENPFTNDEILQKYHRLMALAVDRATADRLADQVLHLESARSLSELTNALATEAKVPY